MIEKIKELILRENSKLTFEEKVHRYEWGGRRVPKSVSKKVEEFVPAFDEQFWSKTCENKGDYAGMSQHQIIHHWQTINTMACLLGTNTHTFLENYRGHQSPSTPQEEAGIKFLKWLMSQTYEYGGRTLKKYTILFRELRLYSKRWDYAGTMDLPVWDNELEGVVIFDYKTNKELFKAFGWMLGIFSFLQNHNYNHYQVQLSYYHLLFEEIGVKVIDRQIVYLMADGEYRLFPLEDYTQDLTQYLDKQPKKLKHEAW